MEFNADAGLGIINLSGTANEATTYYGLRGSLEACDAKQTGFYLCGGVSALTTLDAMSKTTASGTIKSSLNTVGGYVKAKTNLSEGWAFASYGGISRFNFKHVSASSTLKESAYIFITGLELDKQIKGNVSVSLKGEVGHTIGVDNDRKVYSIKPGIKVKF